jgi:RNA polymerase sigma-70 factor (ECF subfamily)
MRALDDGLRPRLLRYFHEAPFTREDAEDLVQKSLLLVFQHVGELDDEERFVGWLYAIARNVKITARERRRAERRVVLPESGSPGVIDAFDPPAAERQLSGAERSRLLVDAVGRLPPRQRQCLALRIRDELSYQEIAALLRLDVLTVRNHLAEARKALRRLLARDRRRVGP